MNTGETDFAAAAMMRLIQTGLARQGLLGPSIDAGKGARVDLLSKRSVIKDIGTAHGAKALLGIGAAIHDMPDEPALAAILPAKDPFDLFERWQRLERYAHSRHRTEIVYQTPKSMTIRHFARQPHPPPNEEEDLLIFGLLAALFGITGATSLTAGPSGSAIWLHDGRWHVPRSALGPIWSFEWQGVLPKDVAPISENSLPSRLHQLISLDPTRGWTVATAADALALSKRTLQRRLREDGAGFAEILSTVRAAAAARALRTTDLSLAAIGFTSGYADQAHFGREFKRLSAMTPAQYRSEFS